MPVIVVCALQFSSGFWPFTEVRTDYVLTRSLVRCEELHRERGASFTTRQVFSPAEQLGLQALCGPKLEDCKKD